MLIHNPSAGMHAADVPLAAALAALGAAGWRADVQSTTRGGEATRLASEAAHSNYDAVFAVGGDGTVNEVLNGLVDSQTALGVLPLGTANVWAKEMGLPLNNPYEAVCRQITHAEPRLIDVGEARVNESKPRAFLLSCGIGFDAHITAEIESQRALKRQLGALMFWLVGMRTAFTFRGRRAQITIDGKTLRRRLLMAVISNAQLYGGLVRLSPDAQVDDGYLDLALFLGTGVGHAASHFVRVFAGLHRRAPDVEHYRAREITIRGPRLPVHVDAEPIATTPAHIRVRPKALYVLVPVGANRTLFASADDSRLKVWRR